MATKTKECLDLFIEIPYLPRGRQIALTRENRYPSPLGNTENKFYELGCYKSAKKECQSNVSTFFRYHYIDMRVIVAPFADIIDYIYFSDHYKKIDVDKYIDKDQCEIIISYLTTLNKSKSARDLTIRFFTNLLNANQEYDDEILKNYPREKPTDVGRYIDYVVGKIEKELSKLHPDIPKQIFIEMLNRVLNYNVCDTKDYFNGLIASIMDLYVLTRLFIKFEKSKMKRDPKGCVKASKIKNVIIYSGDYHKSVYLLFILNMFTIEPKIHISSTKSKCIELPNDFKFIKIKKY